MKQYETVETTEQKVAGIRCNCCGRLICPDKAHPYRNYLSIEKEWGYDSPYDGERHSMEICSDCYQKWISSFSFPPERTGE